MNADCGIVENAGGCLKTEVRVSWRTDAILQRVAFNRTNRLVLVDGMVASPWTGAVAMVTPPVPCTAGVQGGDRLVACSMTWVTSAAASLRL